MGAVEKSKWRRSSRRGSPFPGRDQVSTMLWPLRKSEELRGATLGEEDISSLSWRGWGVPYPAANTDVEGWPTRPWPGAVT